MTKSNKIVIYTAIFGNYDILHEPEIVTPNVDYVCFTDNMKFKSKTWNVIHSNIDKKTNAAKNRYYKLLAPFKELSHYDKSLYVDGNIIIKKDLTEFFRKYNNIDFGNFKHPLRNCIFTEIEACIREDKGDKVGLFKQGIYYTENKMPHEYGLSDNKILLRDNRNPKVKELMIQWWEQVEKFSGRDQVSLAYVLYKNDRIFNFFEESIMDTYYFELWPHRKEYTRRIWRSFKRFSEKNGLFRNVLKSLEKKVKPKFIKPNA